MLADADAEGALPASLKLLDEASRADHTHLRSIGKRYRVC
jgi:hypothetical protein